MPVVTLYDVIVIALAVLFLMQPIQHCESMKRLVADKCRPSLSAVRTNFYFLFTCAVIAMVLELFVPYGRYIVLAPAACGLCYVVLDCLLLIRYVIFERSHQTKCLEKEDAQNCPNGVCELRKPADPASGKQAQQFDPFRIFY